MRGQARKHVIAINPLAVHPLKTMIHEIAHCLLHEEPEFASASSGSITTSIDAEPERAPAGLSTTINRYDKGMYCSGTTGAACAPR